MRYSIGDKNQIVLNDGIWTLAPGFNTESSALRELLRRANAYDALVAALQGTLPMFERRALSKADREQILLAHAALKAAEGGEA